MQGQNEKKLDINTFFFSPCIIYKIFHYLSTLNFITGLFSLFSYKTIILINNLHR